MVTWIAEYKKYPEIQRLVQETFGKSVHISTLRQYEEAECWQALIHKTRKKYESDIYKVELANERKRIEKLQDVVERNFESGKDNIVISGIREIHEHLKKPEFLNQNNYQINIYKEMTEEEFDKRELELIQKRKQLKAEIEGEKNGL